MRPASPGRCSGDGSVVGSGTAFSSVKVGATGQGDRSDHTNRAIIAARSSHHASGVFRSDPRANSGSAYHLIRRARMGRTPFTRAMRYSPESCMTSLGNSRGRDISDQLRLSDQLDEWVVGVLNPS